MPRRLTVPLCRRSCRSSSVRKACAGHAPTPRTLKDVCCTYHINYGSNPHVQDVFCIQGHCSTKLGVTLPRLCVVALKRCACTLYVQEFQNTLLYATRIQLAWLLSGLQCMHAIERSIDPTPNVSTGFDVRYDSTSFFAPPPVHSSVRTIPRSCLDVCSKDSTATKGIQNAIAPPLPSPLTACARPPHLVQILTQYADITAVEFPPSFAKFLSWIDVVNLDIGWLFSASCVLPIDFYGRLLMTTLGPLALGSALACTFLYAR